MNHHRFSRRALLKKLGASAAMLPLLHSEKAPAAMSSGFPKRLVTVVWTNGIIANSFYPTGADLTLGATLAPLEPWKSKVLMPMGLDLKVLLDLNRQYDGHFTYPTLFTGTGENKSEGTTGMGPSIDQVISDDIRTRVNLPVPALHLGVKSMPGGQPSSWRASGQKNVPETDPFRLFDSLFTSAAMPGMQVDVLRQRRQSVLDFLNKDLTAFSQRLGTDDRIKIQGHMDSVRELEKQLQTPTAPAVSCTGPMLPAKGTKLDNPALIKAMFDITAIALRCDLTRVATFDLFCDGGGDGNSFPQVGVTRDYHTVAHAGAGGAAEKIKIDSWLFTQVANLVKQLDDTKEGAGTALDNSVIVTATDMDDGANHYVGKIPFLLIGSCGGFFKTGRVVRYSKVPHNKLLATLCNAMDLPVTSFGAKGYEGTLPELSM
ncbi:MAG TPA: DUF1552 domain-containing protein [Polyangia bacterium]|nr:DUF1552 domain-containing protein [Polyangia bacterium]